MFANACGPPAELERIFGRNEGGMPEGLHRAKDARNELMRVRIVRLQRTGQQDAHPQRAAHATARRRCHTAAPACAVMNDKALRLHHAQCLQHHIPRDAKLRRKLSHTGQPPLPAPAAKALPQVPCGVLCQSWAREGMHEVRWLTSRLYRPLAVGSQFAAPLSAWL